MPKSMILRIFSVVVSATILPVITATAVELADIAEAPLAHGAWLYKVNCTRCHGSYEKQRPGESYRTEESLAEAVAKGGCRISWGQNDDKTLSGAELAAISHYIRAWEDLGREPALPELPAFVPAKPPSTEKIETTETIQIPAPGENVSVNKPLANLIETNPVARGAWLYTGNCYRCHLSYAATRQARNISLDTLRKVVENGKTSTQMTGFGLLAGGKLKSSEIDAIISYISIWERFDSPPAIAAELLVPPAIDPTDLRPIGLPRFPPVHGDVTDGKRLFLTHCSGCHNSDRSGYIGRRLLPPWGSMRPDLFLKSTVKNGIPGSLMPTFSVNADGSLNPKQIEDIVAFLLGN